VEMPAGKRQVSAGWRDHRGEEVTRSFVNRLLRLAPLAPDIVEAISVGSSRRGCSCHAPCLPNGQGERDLVAQTTSD
jgi:hypothetical protein